MRAMVRARLAGGLLVGLLAASIGIGAVALGRGCHDLRPPRAGVEAPDFALPRIDDAGRIVEDEVSLSSLRGRAVVIDFWATWCQPCRQSMPVIGRTVAKKGERAVLLSVGTDGWDAPERARRLVDELAPGGVLVADDGAIADMYGVSTIPHLVIVSPEGRIVAVERRFTTAVALQRSLAAALDRALGD